MPSRFYFHSQFHQPTLKLEHQGYLEQLDSPDSDYHFCCPGKGQ